MKSITGDKRSRALSQVGFRREYGAMMLRVSDQIGGILRRNAGADGLIPTSKIRDVKAAAGQVIQRAFVGPDSRNAYAADGVTPLAEYPRILNKYYMMAVAGSVKLHTKWMRRNVPEDVFNKLKTTRTQPVPVEKETARNAVIREAALSPDGARILNPHVAYDPAHTWVDSRGYRLSDRIWQTEQRTRAKLDALLDDLIRQQYSAEQISRRVEQFLHPERNSLRTNKPYGSDGSFDGLRLARSEIARAANNAAAISAYMNPYVGSIDVARSPNGDPTCKVCPQYATIDISQNRVRKPYPVSSAPSSIFHPQCMCRLQPNVDASPEEITEWLRSILDDPKVKEQMHTTPANFLQFMKDLLGPILFIFFLQEFGGEQP